MKAVCQISVANLLLEVEFVIYEVSMEYASYNKNCSLTCGSTAKRDWKRWHALNTHFFQIVLPLVTEVTFSELYWLCSGSQLCWLVLWLTCKENFCQDNRFKDVVVVSEQKGRGNEGQKSSLIYNTKVCLQVWSWFFSETKAVPSPYNLLSTYELEISSSNLWETEATEPVKLSFWVELSFERNWKC